MDSSRLYGVQYARVAPDAIAPLTSYLGVHLGERDELIVTVEVWPESIRPAPLRARDGRLIAGDPLVIDATPRGLVFHGADGQSVLVVWADIRELQALRMPAEQTA
jgi:hypothetical protein